ncbi:LOW QUALITY PROTEIN: cadherin-13 [Thalassophryne amazonica]|uniref:LOW QUALITY PROTEIN: cadherin-13 n=1 Tax=Thalassophryne amazonica TaxID=390379 RepID=UPI0014708A31|nr:LOW QUALITY PROTEIN: cadherin-13 [Thalassophryne amazonica]
MEPGVRVLLAFLLHQVACVDGQEDGRHEGCVPGFQIKHYQLAHSGPFHKGQPLLRVKFDDCAGNWDVTFEVSDPIFYVDRNLNLIPQQDVLYSGPVIFIHGLSAHADDTAQVDISGLPVHPPQTLREILGFGKTLPNRSKRALLVPPLVVPENQRAPFPRIIGRSHVISSERALNHFFRLTGPGADQDPRGLFTIDMDTGDVLVSRSLDREDIDSYQLEVSTMDLLGNIVEGPAILVITVIDQNDNRPIFKENRYTGEVLEGSPTGTTVMTMTAFDADDPATNNAVLRYNIIRQSPDKPSPNMFYIDPERGDIVTVISPTLLDRETLPTTTYELEIVAKDMAGSEVGLTGTATATITITDKNDHAPEFTHPLFEAHVNEGSTGVVVNLTVDDRDDPATGAWRAIYSIINGDPTQSFEIQTNPDNNEGMLSVVKPLDYEATAFHTLLIKVENEDYLVPDVGYGPSSTATVHVTVLDINEGPVFFPDPLTVTRMENIPVGSFVASLNATDPDILQSQSIRYAVLRDPAGWLSVNPVRGTVNTSALLDRESPYVHDNKYTAVFIATDNGSPPATGTGTLLINLEDYNDNAPEVHPSVARVCEDAHDMNVAIVGGRDMDLPPNAAPFKIELGKQAGLDKTWRVTRVNSTHSQIMLLHSLKKANYQLPLLITDSGVPPLSSNTEVKVQVCVCKKNKMHCSSAHSLHGSLVTLLATLLLTLLCL